MDYEIALACGHLRLRTIREEWPLPSLLDFASRQNPRRGFLFVSKVLGKHIPCTPRRMREAYDRLSEGLVEVPGPVLAIGLAETATGLGAGIADSLARATGRADILFQHTTRHRLPAPLLLEFDEIHSHAPDHMLYAPLPDLAERYRQTATLILIDDEITTGRTLTRIAEQLAARLPRVKQLVFVSLVNWLDGPRRLAIEGDLGIPTRFVSLLEGTFSFSPHPDFTPALPSRVAARCPARRPPRSDTGRQAVAMPLDRGAIDRAADRLTRSDASVSHGMTVIGTGELAYPPFLLAEALEQRGVDVLFQGTTRSPILIGGAIEASLSIADEHGEGVQNYLHNPPPPSRRSIVVYECEHHAHGHDLPSRLGSEAWVLPSATQIS